MVALSEFGLRLAALFYAVVFFIGLRRVALDRLLDTAIAAISGKQDQSPGAQADRIRRNSLLLNMVLGGLASILAAAMIDISAFVLLIAASSNIFNLAVVLPMYGDRYDPPEPAARRKSWMATLFFTLFTFWALAHWQAGNMTSVADTHPLALSLAICGALAFSVQTLRTLRASALPAAAPVKPSADEDWDRARLAELESYREVAFVLRPSLQQNVLFRADNGAPLPYHTPVAELNDNDKRAMEDWQANFRQALDPDDPRQVRFRSEQAEAAFRAEGEDLYQRLRRALGDHRIRYDSQPAAREPAIHRTRILVRAAFNDWPLADQDGLAIYPSDLAISLRLDEDLMDWSSRYESAVSEAGETTLHPSWTSEEWDRYDAQGASLAERLRSELEQTGRTRVAVSYLSMRPAR